MYIFLLFANDNFNVIILVTVIVVLLIFPFVLEVSAFISKENKSLYFSFKLFSLLLILQGNIKAKNNGLIITYNNKTIYFPFKKILDIKEKIKPLRDYHVVKCKILVNIGLEEKYLEGLVFASVAQSISQVIFISLKELKNYVKIRQYINVCENLTDVNCYIKLKILFNILTVILSLIKKTLGKIFLWMKTKID